MSYFNCTKWVNIYLVNLTKTLWRLGGLMWGVVLVYCWQNGIGVIVASPITPVHHYAAGPPCREALSPSKRHSCRCGQCSGDRDGVTSRRTCIPIHNGRCQRRLPSFSPSAHASCSGARSWRHLVGLPATSLLAGGGGTSGWRACSYGVSNIMYFRCFCIAVIVLSDIRSN